jgi:hypothetical protein
VIAQLFGELLDAPDLVRGEEPTAGHTLPPADDKDADEFGIGLAE